MILLLLLSDAEFRENSSQNIVRHNFSSKYFGKRRQALPEVLRNELAGDTLPETLGNALERCFGLQQRMVVSDVCDDDIARV